MEREKLIELLEQSLIHKETGREMRFTGGDTPVLANGVTVQKWIPVSERLPEVVDSYIVAIKSKSAWEKDYAYYVDVATYNPYEKAYIDDCWNTYVDWDEGQQYLHITHWMPLPEPPKGE